MEQDAFKAEQAAALATTEAQLEEAAKTETGLHGMEELLSGQVDGTQDFLQRLGSPTKAADMAATRKARTTGLQPSSLLLRKSDEV